MIRNEYKNYSIMECNEFIEKLNSKKFEDNVNEIV